MVGATWGVACLTLPAAGKTQVSGNLSHFLEENKRTAKTMYSRNFIQVLEVRLSQTSNPGPLDKSGELCQLSYTHTWTKAGLGWS